MEILKRSKFDKLLEKATSELLIDPDLECTLIACDMIRGQEISAKNAVASVRKRLQHDNPNVVLHTLFVLESMMKNCGSAVHDEVASSEFMQAMKSTTEKSFDVRNRVLICIQNWAFAFKDKPNYAAIHSMYNELKGLGYTFPALSETAAMFSVDDAPQWKEETICHRCKVTFTTFRRRHHCRNCGNSVCADCSNERMVLPKFGIEKEVRVCDHCFERLKHHRSDTPIESEPVKEHKPQQPTKNDQAALLEKQRKERELETREAEELELALALSASEAECKERERRKQQSHLQRYDQKGTTTSSEPQAAPPSDANNGPLKLLPVLDTSDMDPELARYLNRHYWENRASAAAPSSSSAAGKQRPASPTQPSAPIYATLSPPSKVATVPLGTGGAASGSGANKTNSKATTSTEVNASNTPVGGSCNPPGVPELTTPKQEEFLNALRGSIEFFMNRLQSNSQRGRSIASDTTVQTLFLTLHEMHPELLKFKQSMEQRRAYFEEVQDKLTQLREAREALDALRQEHATRRLLEEQEAARMRQLQMMQKLEMMRQQKRDTLEYRRRMALQQTMHYEQQYQSGHYGPPHQNPAYGIDPATGLPYAGAPVTSSMYPPASSDYAYRGYGAPAGYPMGGVPTNYPPGVQLESGYHLPPATADPSGQSGYYNGTEGTAAHQQPYGGPYAMRQMEAALPVAGGSAERVDAGGQGQDQQQHQPQQQQYTNNTTPESNMHFAKASAADQSHHGYPSASPPTYSGATVAAQSQPSYPSDQSQVPGHPAMPGPSPTAYTSLPDPPAHEPYPEAAASAGRQAATRTSENQLILFD